jgi:hypothetical protein
MPPLALFLFAAVLGLAALSRRRLGRYVGAALAIGGTLLGATHVGESARLFARASRNIHGQQVEVGRRLAALSPDASAIVLVGDAGAIPYVSRLHAVDALGLGGYHYVPFVRAAVLGEAATVELIERLPDAERPTLLALYPNWFPGITATFGRERDQVTITDNVICGGVTKGIYDADWSTLRSVRDRGAPDEPFASEVLDEIDLADVVSEEAHAYASPAPRGGWTELGIHANGRGDRRFDAGRITPQGEEESFALAVGAAAGATLVLRTDDATVDVAMQVIGASHSRFEAPFARAAGRAPDAAPGSKTAPWYCLEARLPAAVSAGDRVHLVVRRGELHDFHAWLLGGNP